MENNKQFKIYFKWIGAATWVLKIDNLKLACDPVLCPKDTVQVHAPGFKSKRLTEPVFDEDDFENIDVWLISHEHEDHLDEYGLSKIDSKAIIAANKKAKKKLQAINPKKLNIVRCGQVLIHEIAGLSVEITAMPTVHASNSIMAFLLGGGNGYWLNVKKNDATLKIYVSGDTIGHKKVINALHDCKADILIPNIGAPYQNAFGGPFTFTIDTLQPVIDKIKPEIILPVHFGSFSHFRESSSTIKAWADERVKIFNEGDCFQN